MPRYGQPRPSRQSDSLGAGRATHTRGHRGREGITGRSPIALFACAVFVASRPESPVMTGAIVVGLAFATVVILW